MQIRVHSITHEASGINAYELIHPEGMDLPYFTAGSHIDVHLPGGFVRQYSLCNNPAERHRYVIGVLGVEGGRGGSKAFHEQVRAGDILTVSQPRNNFPLAENATRHLFLAGGIGITPILSMLERLADRKDDFILAYCTRSRERTAFRRRLSGLAHAGHIVFHHDDGDPAKTLNVADMLRRHDAGTHLYCCGPSGFMNAVKSASAHWPRGSVHFEFFAPPPDPPATANLPTHSAEDAFKIKLASSGAVFFVPSEKSIVQVLREHGISCETSCEAGMCGTCRTRYLEGSPDHRDYVLSEEDRGEYVMICCARSQSEVLVLDI